MEYKKHTSIAKRNESVLLIIDLQEKLYPHIFERNKILLNIEKLIKVAKILKIPIIITEQEKLGRTIKQIREILEEDYQPIRKISFSCMESKKFRNKIKNLKRKNFIIVGIEAHICVEQTALDLLANNYKVHVVRDAVSSRKKGDIGIAIDKIGKSGAIITSTEMVIYELLESAGTKEFKQVLEIVKS
jgi:nicotinamidase-related amidase